ncbi:MAG: NPCBM/NEW2 domain-containing protein [Bacillota bacterium]
MSDSVNSGRGGTSRVFRILLPAGLILALAVGFVGGIRFEQRVLSAMQTPQAESANKQDTAEKRAESDRTRQPAVTEEGQTKQPPEETGGGSEASNKAAPSGQTVDLFSDLTPFNGTKLAEGAVISGVHYDKGYYLAWNADPIRWNFDGRFRKLTLRAGVPDDADMNQGSFAVVVDGETIAERTVSKDRGLETFTFDVTNRRIVSLRYESNLVVIVQAMAEK